MLNDTEILENVDVAEPEVEPEETEKESLKETIMGLVRLLAMMLAGINSLLIAKGMHPIPFDATIFTEVAAHVADFALGVWAWWKDNNMTKKAQNRKKQAAAIEAGEAMLVTAEHIDDPEFDEIIDEIIEEETEEGGEAGEL